MGAVVAEGLGRGVGPEESPWPNSAAVLLGSGDGEGSAVVDGLRRQVCIEVEDAVGCPVGTVGRTWALTRTEPGRLCTLLHAAC